MTIKTKELTAKLEVLRDLYKKRDKTLRDETDLEADHITFLERHLYILTQMVEVLRAGRSSSYIKAETKRGQSPKSNTGQSTLKHSVHPCVTSLTRMAHKRGNLSGDWHELASVQRDRLTHAEYPLSSLRNQASTSTLQKKTKGRTNSYVSNLYNKNYTFGSPESQNVENQPSISPGRRFRKKTESHRANFGGGSFSEQRNRELEQSRSLVRFNYNPESHFQESRHSIRKNITSPSDLSPHLQLKKFSVTSDVIQTKSLKKNQDSKQLKKPPEIQTTANFEDGEVHLFREAFSNKAGSKASANFGKVNSLQLDSGVSSNLQILNLKRRETMGGKPMSPQVPPTGAFDSPSKKKTSSNKTESEIPFETPVYTNVSWSKQKSRQSKRVSQDLLNNYGSAGVSASKLIHDLLRARHKNPDKSSSKFASLSKPSIPEHSMSERNLVNGTSIAAEETVRIEEESDKKTEKKSSPINRTHLDMFGESPRNLAQNIVLKEMSHRSEFISESQSLIAESSRLDN